MLIMILGTFTTNVDQVKPCMIKAVPTMYWYRHHDIPEVIIINYVVSELQLNTYAYDIASSLLSFAWDSPTFPSTNIILWTYLIMAPYTHLTLITLPWSLIRHGIHHQSRLYPPATAGCLTWGRLMLPQQAWLRDGIWVRSCFSVADSSLRNVKNDS